MNERRRLIAEALRAGASIHQQGNVTRISLAGRTVRILPNGKALIEGAQLEQSRAVRDFCFVRRALGLKRGKV